MVVSSAALMVRFDTKIDGKSNEGFLFLTEASGALGCIIKKLSIRKALEKWSRDFLGTKMSATDLSFHPSAAKQLENHLVQRLIALFWPST